MATGGIELVLGWETTGGYSGGAGRLLLAISVVVPGARAIGRRVNGSSLSSLNCFLVALVGLLRVGSILAIATGALRTGSILAISAGLGALGTPGAAAIGSAIPTGAGLVFLLIKALVGVVASLGALITGSG